MRYCLQPIDFKNSKTDEGDCPVHQDCNAMKMTSLDRPKKLHRVSILARKKSSRWMVSCHQINASEVN